MRPTNMSSEALIRHVKWFLTTKLRRPFDYSKAHRFLLFILLKSNIGLKLLKTYDLAADLEYGLLAHEGALVEFGGDFAHINGASLFKVVGGNMFFYLCNSQIAPSEIWREGFKCVPDHTSPYCWRDENGNIVLRFERIASPIREAMHEKYYRQPILFRWLCNSEWLKETLCKHNLHLRYVSRLESIP